jgi:hypothetical protein
MNSTLFFIAVIQEAADQRLKGIITAVVMALAFFGLMYLIFIKLPPQDPPVDAIPDENQRRPLGSPITNQIEGCIGSLFKLLFFLCLLGGILFVIVKAVKFVWFF